MGAPPRHNRLLRMTRLRQGTQSAAQPAPEEEEEEEEEKEEEEEELLPGRPRKQAARTCESCTEALVLKISYHTSGMGVLRSAS